MRRKYILVIAFVLCIVTPVLIQPVAASSTTYYYDSIDERAGDWNTATDKATEAWYGWMLILIIWFEFENVPQTADVYKIRIDYDSLLGGGLEFMLVYYRWGDESRWGPHGGWMRIDTCGPLNVPHDSWITIADPSDTTLQVCFQDTWPYEYIFPPTGDGVTIWDFGREPCLKLYW